MKSEMWKGNHAMAEAAVRAGCKLYAGYPITPSSEIMEYLSRRLPEVGGSFIQAESELAGINMIIGGASCGYRCLTASSGPGMSLKQEGLSTLADEGLAAVVINVVRYGNGLGTLYTAQGDYLRDTRGGGNGDYRTLVLCPASIQEAVDMVAQAYELAEKYRMVCLIMTEGALGQMMEPVTLPDFIDPPRMPWALDGHYTYKKIGIFDRDSRKEGLALREKYDLIKEREQRWEEAHLGEAEYVFVAFGLPGRSAKGLVERLRAEGLRVGLIRPITAWPYPDQAFRNVNGNVKGIITVEADSVAQMADDAALAIKRALPERNVPVYGLPYVYGIPKSRQIREDFQRILDGQLKPLY